MDNKVELTVQGVINSRVQSNAYALILKDEGPRRLPVIIGLSEAQSIAVALEGMATSRPMTHDLIVGMTHAFRLKMKEVFIYRFEDGVFFSELVFWENDGKEIRIDSRTSDDVALALRLKCPIYTFESLLQRCAIVPGKTAGADDSLPPDDMDPEEIHDPQLLRKWLRRQEAYEIEAMLEKAVGEEKYELAKIYQDELVRREPADGPKSR